MAGVMVGFLDGWMKLCMNVLLECGIMDGWNDQLRFGLMDDGWLERVMIMDGWTDGVM